MIQFENATVYHGSNLDILPTLPDNSVDSIVTDPPYELGFMGKKWDRSGIAYSVELWQECLRVLKPGGHLLAFGGSRTWHRLAVAVEDAGFEMRDSIAWLYGSGFPKSMDVSKAIDKHDATESRNKRDLQFVEWMRTTGLKQAEINKIIGKSDVGSHYLRLDQPVVATAELFDKLRPYLPKVPEHIERMVAERTIESENFKKREVIGQKTGTKSVDGGGHGIVPGGITESVSLDITAPATDEAKKWSGWGTALKPAFEPVVVARKPLIGTVAANVLEWGVGGLNIDGSRIGTGTGEKKTVEYPDIRGGNYGQDGEAYADRATVKREVVDQGRWPANIILDEYTAGLLDEQSGVSKSPTVTTRGANRSSDYGFGGQDEVAAHGDSGGASRFFYVAKASKKDRNEGLDGIEAQSIGDKGNGLGRTCATCGASVLDGCDCPDRTFVNPTRQNFHPTVKPTALMEYLIRLVTPAGGVVLDPFTGSGSTGKAALLNGYKFIGCELTEEYLPIIEGRLKHAAEQYAAKTTEEETTEQETLF